MSLSPNSKAKDALLWQPCPLGSVQHPLCVQLWAGKELEASPGYWNTYPMAHAFCSGMP